MAVARGAGRVPGRSGGFAVLAVLEWSVVMARVVSVALLVLGGVAGGVAVVVLVSGSVWVWVGCIAAAVLLVVSAIVLNEYSWSGRS